MMTTIMLWGHSAALTTKILDKALFLEKNYAAAAVVPITTLKMVLLNQDQTWETSPLSPVKSETNK